MRYAGFAIMDSTLSKIVSNVGLDDRSCSLRLLSPENAESCSECGWSDNDSLTNTVQALDCVRFSEKR